MMEKGGAGYEAGTCFPARDVSVKYQTITYLEPPLSL